MFTAALARGLMVAGLLLFYQAPEIRYHLAEALVDQGQAGIRDE